jgi:hypothetical protein
VVASAGPDHVRKAEARSVRSRRRGEDGAALVEFAFVLSFLALLIFGIIDFGSIYNDYQALRSGVRDGTRDAVVTNFGSDTSCGSSVTDSPAVNVICRVKNRAGLGNNIRVGIWAPGGWTVGASLRICAQAAADSTTGVMGPFVNGRAMTSKVEMRIEQILPNGVVFTAAQEAPLTSWPSKCTTG